MTDDHFVCWLHVGDIHASDEDGWASVDTLRQIVDAVGKHVPAGALDFAFLPGDNANHGEREQYRRVADALEALELPRFVIPGDHDFEPRSLESFNEHLATLRLPASVRINGRRALFLDIVSAGEGGPDFRLGGEQMVWLSEELRRSREGYEPGPLVFMHAFPGDLQRGGRAIGRLFADAHVAFVDTGHTHYNELLNDGAVIYSATRSTGQIEEGPAGFAVAAVDGAAASWRFKTLDSPWPWVLITAPADGRMTTSDTAFAGDGPLRVRALVLGRDVVHVEASIDDEAPVTMHALPGRPGRWSASFAQSQRGARRIRVVARDASGAVAEDTIVVAARRVARSAHLGDHDAGVGAWPEHGVLGTRLGPNANGKAW